MMHVNAVDKFLKNNTGYILIALLVVFFIGLIGFKIYDNHNARQSIEYTTGYSNGFNEVNLTRYSVAKQVYSSFGRTILEPPNVLYARGYLDGYDDGVASRANSMMGYIPHN